MPARSCDNDRDVNITPMSNGQRVTVVAVMIAAIVLGIMVEWRSAFLQRRMTDLGCYIRGAWAIRVGADPYTVTDDNGWHYNYPPFLAILMGPLAQAPPGGNAVTALPYPVSVAVWYAIGFGCLLLAAHWLAMAIEAGLSRPVRRYGYLWWSLRLVPLILILPASGRTLARGQVNTIVLAMLAGWIAGLVTGRRRLGGMCLGFAIAIKIIPAFLVLHPLWRRDGRSLVGLALGIIFALGVLPTLVSGPSAALAQFRTFIDVTLRPGLGTGGDASRAEELTDVTSTDSQSILCVLHNFSYLNPWARSPIVAPWTRVAHWSIAGCLTALTLLVHGRRPITTSNEIAFIGALMVVMTLITPVSHLHYFVFALPMVTALWCRPHRQVPYTVLGFFLLANIASLLPILAFRLYGLTPVAALLLWAMALIPERPTDYAGQRLTDRTITDAQIRAPQAA